MEGRSRSKDPLRHSRSYCQSLPRAEGVKLEPIARKLADSIIAERAHQRLKRRGDEAVRILMAKIFPYDSA